MPPLAGSVPQGVAGASILLEQPYHDTLEQAGSFFRMATDRFLRSPERAFQRSVLSFRGDALPQTLCKDEAVDGGVLSATCRDLADFVVLVVGGQLQHARTRRERVRRPAWLVARVVGVLASCCDSCLLFLATLLLATGLAEKA